MSRGDGKLLSSGEKPYLLFYKGYLSQWHPSVFVVDGVQYNCAEHWMMAEKARLFRDKDTLAKILAADNPRLQKSLGRRVRGFKEGTWKAHRFKIVVAGNVHKFEQNPKLLRRLLGTDSRMLVEASPRDFIWGVGLRENDRRAADKKTWRGQNLLGFALMEARKILSDRGVQRQDGRGAAGARGSRGRPGAARQSTRENIGQ